MRKEEFLRQLEMLLSDISEEERADAMAFYRSYFEDAGEGNELHVLEELGSPENVAEIIKRDLGMVTVTSTGSADETQSTYDESSYTYTYRNEKTQREGYTINNDSVNPSYNEKKSNNTLIWVIVIAILTSPLWFGIVTGILGTVIGLSAALFGCTVAVFVVGAAFVGLGITMIAGISGAAGIAFMGAGLIVLAIALLLLLACVWIFGKFFPWAVNGVVTLCKKPFGKDKGAQAV